MERVISSPDQKDQIRKAAFARRKAAHAEIRDADTLIRDHFLAARLHTGMRVISAYRPIRTEIDVTPLMQALEAAGHRLCVPVIEAAGLPLRFREWTSQTVMVPGPFGAEVPEAGDWLEPELVLAPLVAFDRAGWRLGYGGGFYDRSLEGLRRKRRTLAVGVGYAAQEVPEVPVEPTDQPLDAMLTEAGLIRFGARRG